jgi:hypothetical protein
MVYGPSGRVDESRHTRHTGASSRWRGSHISRRSSRLLFLYPLLVWIEAGKPLQRPGSSPRSNLSFDRRACCRDKLIQSLSTVADD